MRSFGSPNPLTMVSESLSYKIFRVSAKAGLKFYSSNVAKTKIGFYIVVTMAQKKAFYSQRFFVFNLNENSFK